MQCKLTTPGAEMRRIYAQNNAGDECEIVIKGFHPLTTGWGYHHEQ